MAHLPLFFSASRSKTDNSCRSSEDLKKWIELEHTNSFFDYISLLKKNEKQCTIIVAVKGTAGLYSEMIDIGSVFELKRVKNSSFAFIKSGGSVQVDLNSAKTEINVTERIGNSLINVSSAGLDKGNYAHILIDGIDWSINSLGTNIVVYDHLCGCVIDAICFDTTVKECPCVRKIPGNTICGLESSIYSIQKTLDVELSKNETILRAILYKTFGEDYKKEMFKYVPKAEGDLRLLQEAAVCLLKEFTKICEQNGIEYFFIGGTLLGAFRHNGFIPWDDDIDVGITKKNLDKLFDVLEKSDTLSIIIGINWNRYLYRLVFKGLKAPFIDLFLMEYCQYPVLEMKEKHKELRPLFLEKYRALPPIDNWCCCTRKIKNEFERIRNSIITDEYSYENKEGIASISFSINHVQSYFVVEKEIIYPLKKCIYEGIECYIPSDAQTYLERVYGDIYRLPDDMTTHKHIKINDKRIQACREILKKYS